MGRTSISVLLAVAAALAGCSLLLDDGGLSGEGENDAGDAATVDVGAPADTGAETTGADAGEGPSCASLGPICGPSPGRSCCASAEVTGGTFKRGYDGVTEAGAVPDYPATVGSFRLDGFEVTLGRFRAFVAEYPANLPAAGAGKNPRNATDLGWDAAWNDLLPKSREELVTALHCTDTEGYVVWTDAPGPSENKPINCLSWFEAFAFCIWDGGRLPTEAEWNYAAAGGGGADGQRVYPWSSPPTSTVIDETYARYQGGAAIFPVGSKSPKGDGKWGHSDLAGNLIEWTVDWFAEPYSATCIDCANLVQSSAARVLRGGSFNLGPNEQLTAHRSNWGPGVHNFGTGTRCARTP